VAAHAPKAAPMRPVWFDARSVAAGGDRAGSHPVRDFARRKEDSARGHAKRTNAPDTPNNVGQ